MIRLTSATITVLWLLGPAVQGGLLERYWINPSGGAFQDQANWDGPVPADGDTALFALGSAYTVTLEAATITDRLIVRDGNVELAMNGQQYDLLGTLLQQPSLLVGDDPRYAPSLAIADGVLEAVHSSIGDSPGSFGSLQVSGSGTALLNGSTLQVGRAGLGLLSISGQAEVSAFNGFLGGEESAVGLVTVTGPQSLLDVTSNLSIGEQGEGEVIVAGGGLLNTGSSFIGQQIGSLGDVNVYGIGSTWFIEGFLDVGQVGTGSLTIAGGATVHTTGFATIGTFPEPAYPPLAGGDGTVLVTGVGSTWTVDGELDVAFGYTGELTVRDGGAVYSNGGSIAQFSAEISPDQSQVTVSGPGSLWSASTSIVANSPLRILDSAVVSCDELQILDLGALTGDGTVQANVLCGGTIAPAFSGLPLDDVPSTLAIDGDLELTSSSEFIVEVDGNAALPVPPMESESDRLDVNGEVLLDGTLEIVRIDLPQPGETFQIISAVAVSGEFTNLIAEPLPSDWEWVISYDKRAVWLEVSEPVFGDIDGNGVVDVVDLILVIVNWGPCPDPPDPCDADLNNNRVVDVIDLVRVIGNWGDT